MKTHPPRPPGDATSGALGSQPSSPDVPNPNPRPRNLQERNPTSSNRDSSRAAILIVKRAIAFGSGGGGGAPFSRLGGSLNDVMLRPLRGLARGMAVFVCLFASLFVCVCVWGGVVCPLHARASAQAPTMMVGPVSNPQPPGPTRAPPEVEHAGRRAKSLKRLYGGGRGILRFREPNLDGQRAACGGARGTELRTRPLSGSRDPG